MLAALIDGINEAAHAAVGAGPSGAARAPAAPGRRATATDQHRECSADRAVLGRRRADAVDAAPGTGQAAIAAVANEEQLERFGGRWAAMAITEPEAGSDSAAIRTTARSTARSTCSTAKRSTSPPASAPIWSSSGRRSIAPAGVRRSARSSSSAPTPACGSSGSTTSWASARPIPRSSASRSAAFRRTDCSADRVRPSDLEQGFGGAMQTFDNTRPLVAAMAVGIAARCAGGDSSPAVRRRGRDRISVRPAACAAGRRGPSCSNWRPNRRRRGC